MENLPAVGTVHIAEAAIRKKAKAVFHAACSDNHKFQVIRRAWFKMNQHTSVQQKQENNQQKYERTQMQREIVIQRLKEQGCRITKQRLILLDVILEGECGSCKEIYYRASKIDRSIGTATVYRMINTLEEIGAIDRKNMYRVQVS